MEDFLLFKKNHQEKEVKLADSQTGGLHDNEYNMIIETDDNMEMCSYNVFSQEETLSAGDDNDYIMD